MNKWKLSGEKEQKDNKKLEKYHSHLKSIELWPS